MGLRPLGRVAVRRGAAGSRVSGARAGGGRPRRLGAAGERVGAAAAIVAAATTAAPRAVAGSRDARATVAAGATAAPRDAGSAGRPRGSGDCRRGRTVSTRIELTHVVMEVTS